MVHPLHRQSMSPLLYVLLMYTISTTNSPLYHLYNFPSLFYKRSSCINLHIIKVKQIFISKQIQTDQFSTLRTVYKYSPFFFIMILRNSKIVDNKTKKCFLEQNQKSTIYTVFCTIHINIFLFFIRNSQRSINSKTKIKIIPLFYQKTNK